MRVFCDKYPDAKVPLDAWYQIAEKASWHNIFEVKQSFPHADAVGSCTVFNIGGNKYRLITKIKYNKQVIYIRVVLTHKEYDKNEWKRDC